MNKPTLTTLIALSLFGCGQGSSTSGPTDTEEIRKEICEPLITQCIFNNVEGCRNVKQLPEQARIDQLNFQAFQCREFIGSSS